jgi:hypothetical protein
VIGDLQQRPRKLGVAAWGTSVLVVLVEYRSQDFQGENPMFALYWLDEAMTLLKTLFWELGHPPG